MVLRKLKCSQGFTLVELLVVIAILAIMATVANLYYIGIQSQTRDSTKRATLYEISTALEVNKTTSSYIPLQVNQFSSFQWSDPQGNAYCLAVGNPPDPSTSSAWGDTCPVGFVAINPGVPGSNFTTWKICTFLEKPVSPAPNVFCKTSSQ